ncbi:bifunctional 3-deoxy-7-phosphoheptulonate synthase/chorismate mutase type II [Mesonia sp. K7]|uniref:bifunctional 3-deoxy-7-phosphoheptulonate synthase/chorismate mutase type II n=1 Tax=Mesonia sp. K7 TaxID=2218606 RepID=UPI000DA77DD3|nr:bifunctional 3-deoxy-7-phosphoheptulonate synthase/chorismate mutase type II [Mesonia sp. K7]PZD77711.1 3-deoxy-7-phosphoheptulonate synthase [Mesonia sp. K7]
MSKDSIQNRWLSKFKHQNPFIIAGPCSAETEEQVVQIAQELKDSEVSVIRAGIWKPRTRPGNFEGVGAIGLNWLKTAKVETGLQTATEVANPYHVELALKNEIDILWIGARTTVSPFNVQEIAEVLRGTNKTVLIKNPVNPDLSLWIGAIERFLNQDVKNLGAIHRGFSSYNNSTYRNVPEWQIAIDLQSEFPEMPIILDPSHIAGRRDLIFELCQTALDLNYNGLMVETHHNPDKAWSDSQQQITPQTLLKFLSELKVRKQHSDDVNFSKDLEKLRAQIDVMDDKLMEVLIDRMQIADKIGGLKKEHNVAIFQPERWKQILEKMIEKGDGKGLQKEFILNLYKAIHQESIAHQQKIIHKN